MKVLASVDCFLYQLQVGLIYVNEMLELGAWLLLLTGVL